MLPDIILIFHIPGIDPVCFLFRVHCLSTLFFLFHTLQIYLIKGIAVQNQLLLFFIQFLSLPDLLSIYYM